MCNRVRGKTGSYWQHETFDHWARHEAEALRIIQYIEMNPVKAGMAETPEAYRWSSARIRKQLEILPGEPIPKSGGVSFQLAIIIKSSQAGSLRHGLDKQ